MAGGQQEYIHHFSTQGWHRVFDECPFPWQTRTPVYPIDPVVNTIVADILATQEARINNHGFDLFLPENFGFSTTMINVY